MRQSLTKLCCTVTALGVCAGAKAIVPGSGPSADQYKGIPQRNAFGLKAPEVVHNEPPPPQLPRLILTGITTILGNKRALMKEQEPGLRPGQQAQELSLILTEGQREGNVEVLLIDELAGSVRVNNSGTIMTLTFEKDGAKLPPTQPTPGIAQAGNGILAPLDNPINPYTPGAATNGMRAFPGRIPRWKAPSSGSAAAGSMPPLPSAPTVPSPTGRSFGQAQNPITPQLPEDITPEEKAALLALEQTIANQSTQQNQGAPAQNPYPVGSQTSPAPLPGAAEPARPIMPQ
jgi:hypothetical protein